MEAIPNLAGLSLSKLPVRHPPLTRLVEVIRHGWLGQLCMNWLLLILNYDFSSMHVCDKTLASDLVSLCMVAQDHIDALERCWQGSIAKPIRAHVCRDTQEF